MKHVAPHEIFPDRSRLVHTPHGGIPSPGRMGWSWDRQNHPERPLWPRGTTNYLATPAPPSARRWGPFLLPPSPEQQRDKDKAEPPGKGEGSQEPHQAAGNYRGPERGPGGAPPPGRQPRPPGLPKSKESHLVAYSLQIIGIGSHPNPEAFFYPEGPLAALAALRSHI
jgi:hypothetical protein